jgi:putative hemolysin
LELVLLLVLLAVSAAFSGSETAFFSLGAAEVARLGGESAAGRRVAALVGRANDLLSALLIGNLLVNTAASVVATSLCLKLFGAGGVAVAVPVVTLLLLMFGEITPKMLALGRRRSLALAAARPLTGWMWLTAPAARGIGAALDALLKALPFDRSGSRPLTTSELQGACDLAVEEGSLTETEGRSLARLLQLATLEVRQIMTPRTSVTSLRRDMTLGQVLDTARRAGFNRYPVLSEDGARPEGLFHLKDLLGGADAPGQPLSEKPLAGDLRPLIFVPESKDVAALLADMRGGGAHLAAVVDEHGDFTGIVTMADCLQALLGPVADTAAHDPEILTLGDGRWVVSGRTDLRQFEETCGVMLPPSRDYVTVAGYMMTALGRVLKPGDRVTLPSARLTVLEMSGHRVDRIQVTRRAAEAAPRGGSGAS